MLDQIRFMIAGSEVTRYHTIRTIQTESVGHHSHQVAVLCAILYPNASAQLLKAALFHDLAEHVTGDIPSPSKKKYGIGEQVSELEDTLLRDVGFEIKLDAHDKRCLKFADIFQGALFCVRELQLGNEGLRIVYLRYKSYAEDMIPTGKEKEMLEIINCEYEETT